MAGMRAMGWLVLVAACGAGDEADPVGTADADTDADTDGDTDTGGWAAPAGARSLGIEVNPPGGEDYIAQLDAAVAEGVTVVPLTLHWSVLEPEPGVFDLTLLDLGASAFREAGVKMSLSIPTADTVLTSAPPDLQPGLADGSLTWADPVVIQRFEALLVEVLDHGGDDLAHLIVANEVDIWFIGRTDEDVAALKGFSDWMEDVAERTHPDLPVGVSVTHEGLADERLPWVVEEHDAVFVTYYQRGNDFSGEPAKDVPSVEESLDEVVAWAAGKPLVFKEFGYATGAAIGGSEPGQVDFVEDLFAAWDAHGDAIDTIIFSRMFDSPRAQCEEEAELYGLGGNEAFIDFLCTLGLHDEDFAAKPGWTTFQVESGRRGF